MTLEKIMDKLKRPFRAEIRAGYLNTSVFGGFDKYILRNLKELKDQGDESCDFQKLIKQLWKLFQDYRRNSPNDREKILAEAIPIIKELDQEIKDYIDQTQDNDQEAKAEEKTESKRKKANKVKNDKKDPDSKRNLQSKKKSKQKEEKQDSKEEQVDLKGDERKILNGLKALAAPVQYIKGIGPKRAKHLKRLDIENIMDLFYYVPRQYSDRSEITPISDIKDLEGEVTIQGKVVSVQQISPKRGMKIIKVGIHDGTGLAFGVWFNQPYIKQYFENGDKVIFNGKVNKKNYKRYRKIELSNPIYENLDNGRNVHTKRIVPIYALTDGVTQKNIREWVKNGLDKYLYKMPEMIPPYFVDKFKLLDIDAAIRAIHFPENKDLLDEAKRRLIFEDFFFLQLGILFNRKTNREVEEGYACQEDRELIKAFIDLLPFTLTGAQQRVWEEISADMGEEKPMYRLLQGDVGSGKTVVATLSLIKGIENGLQGALMAPTEILAEQHYLSLKDWFHQLDLKVELLTGSLKKGERRELLADLEAGEIDVLIGTHALIQDEVKFNKLGVIIIDEQHRFGVHQREQLAKKGLHPHVLVMTATPIPRSLALTVYGNLDLSVIDEMPPGRKPIKTVFRKPGVRAKIYPFVREQLEKGQQAYVVCPLIEESENMDAESATEMAQFLKNEVFREYKIALLTGQTPPEARDETMRAFRDGEIDILVSTTVIEVGVDVPNASIMIIEDSHRFGLAQLHQLRGRVGRGEAQSYCILIGDPTTEEGERRLDAMVETNDGFKIAEEDLAIRGPGEFFGTRQHGLPEFKVANLIRDWEMLEMVRHEVKEMLETNSEIMSMELLQIILEMRFGGDFEL